MTDIHSHVLPEVDDGSNNLEESIEMLKFAEKAGVDKIVFTPHFRDSYNMRKNELSERFDSFKSVAKDMGIKAELFLGQEIYRTEQSISLLKKGELLTMNESKYVLVEFNLRHYSDVTEAVYEFVSAGFVPIVAHVERYPYVEPADVREIKEIGGLIQVNAASVVGKPNKKYKKTVKRYLKEDLVDFVASDIHYTRENHMEEAYKYVMKKFGKERAEKLFSFNACKFC